MKSLMYWDTVFIGDGKGFQDAERTLRKGLGSWWRDRYIHRSKTVPMAAKCKRVHSHVYITVLSGSINWPWSGAMINKVRAWEAKIVLQKKKRADSLYGCQSAAYTLQPANDHH